jgi:hypothetical protein
MGLTEDVWRAFQEALGRPAGSDERPRISWRPLPDGQLEVTYRVRDVSELRHVLEPLGLSEHAGATIGEGLPAARRRRSRQTAAGAARALAIHYLSSAGGGRHTQRAAAEMVERVLDIALPADWARDQARVIARFRSDGFDL